MNDAWSGIISVALAITGIAIIAVLVNKQANTAGIIQAASGGFAQDIQAAVSPVTGGGMGMGNFSSLQMPTMIG
jgi:hypothetical protein